MKIQEVAWSLHHWMRQHDIDPAEVTVVLRAKTENTKHRMLYYVQQEFNDALKWQAEPDKALDAAVGRMQIQGINMVISSLDDGAPVKAR